MHLSFRKRLKLSSNKNSVNSERPRVMSSMDSGADYSRLQDALLCIQVDSENVKGYDTVLF